MRTILFAFFLTLVACKSIQKTPAYFEAVSKHIYAYSSGSISARESIRVRFSHAAVGSEQVGKVAASGLFSLNPSIAGTAKWTDEQTLVFTPDQPFERGKKYVAQLALGKIFKDAQKDAALFEWDFTARQLDFEVLVDGLRAADDLDLTKQQIIGRIRAADAADAAQIEQILTAKQGDKSLKINWLHTPDGLIHDFTVVDVARGKMASAVELSWDGKALGVSKKGDFSVEIPALGDFKVLNVRVENREEICAIVHFSDPILTSQDLKGLISLKGWDGNFRFVIDRNFVRCYPDRRLTGEKNMRISAGIKNTANAPMKIDRDWPIRFDDLKPSLRLVGKGAILPSSEGAVIFPFEAVGLKAVDVEVFKIYNSNILQFFQTNEIEGSQELERVGKIIFQKKLTINELAQNPNPLAWSRYALDLRTIIAQDPGAIYQIRLAFRPSYIDFTCSGDMKWAENNDGQPLGTTDNYGNIQPIFGNYYYGIFRSFTQNSDEEGYEDSDFDYDYSNRDNPCRPEYFNSEKFISRNVFVSNLGLTAKRGRDGSSFVAATDLRTADPAAGVKLEFFNFQLQKIAESSTGGDGLSQLEVKETPFLLVATRGAEKGYLRMADGNSLSVSRFDVAGVEPQKGMKGYIYGERGVWRPGDSIFLNFVLENLANPLPVGHPVTLEVRDARGQLALKTTCTKPVGMVYPFHFATRADAATGNWSAKILCGGAKFEKSLKIETVKPNRLRMEMTFDGKTAISQNDLDNNFAAKFTSSWLHGAPANGLNAKIELQLRAVPTEFKNQKGFIFDDPARKFYAEPTVVFDQNLDTDGKANIPIKIETNGNAPGKLDVQFKMRVFERGGDFSTDQTAIEYFPYETFVGLKIPENRWGTKEIDRKTGGDVTFMAVDKRGNPLANHKIRVGFYKLNWSWWWDEDSENYAQFNNAEYVGAVDETTITTNARGEATWKIRPTEDWGRYLIRATDPIGGHSAGDFFYSGWPDREDNIQARNYAAFLPFTANKEKYSPGETVTLNIPGGESGRVLVTLENGTKVVTSFWQETKSGENKISFQATPDMAPTIYAHVSLQQPHAQTKNSLPIRLYGILPIQIEDPNTQLVPVISMKDVVEPEEQFTVSVTEKTGHQMTYTLDLVDEGLLDLTNFKTPNPWDEFYAREGLGVKTWDLYDYVLGAFGSEMDRILAIGGDNFNQKARNGAQVNRFKSVVKHLGPFVLEKGKTAKHSIKISNYVGSVRAMVVASGEKAYGMAEKTVPVRKPVMVLPTLPRVLGPGEKVSLPVAVFAMESKIKDVSVRIEESSGLISIAGDREKNLHFDRVGDQMATFDFQVGENVGVAKFKIIASGNGETATSEQEILIGNPNPYITTVSSGEIAAGQNWEKTWEKFGAGSSSSAILEVSAVPPINLQQHLSYLIQYPHGCAEQTTSGAFPQLFLADLTNLSKKQAESVTKNVQAGVDKLMRFQAVDGGFSYWPGGGFYDSWVSNYVGHFLIEAKNKGYNVSPSALERWVQFQTKTAKNADFMASTSQNNYSRYDLELSQGYRLYTLALAGQPEIGAMNRMRERPKLFRAAANYLAGAYALSGKPEVGQAIVSEKKFDENAPYEGWCGYTWGSWLRDAGAMLETFCALGDQNRAAQKLEIITSALGSENWFSTQDRAVALTSVAHFAKKFTTSGGLFSYSWQSGGQSGTEKSDKLFSQIELPSGSNRSVSVKNLTSGGQKLFTRLLLTGQPAVGNERAESQNLTLEIKFLDAKNQPIQTDILTSGTDFFAEITVTHGSDLSFNFPDLALTNVFPGGWEISNSRMGNFDAKTSQGIDYQDFRDDRVLSYFNLSRWNYEKGKNISGAKTLRIPLTAAYPGRYYLPAQSCESMYDRRVRAVVPGRWITVVARTEKAG
jgi:alpha-2-macroglobulin